MAQNRATRSVKEGPDYDVIVVGGGPVGSEVARVVAGRGHDVLLLEEHSEIGRPVQCGGLVSSKVLAMARYGHYENSLLGADIHSPGGNLISFKADAPKAFVIDRVDFDRHMADRALKAGCRIELSTKVLSAEYLDGGPGGPGSGIRVETERRGSMESLTCSLLVGADGVQANVARWFGLARAGEVVSGYEMFYDGLDLDADKAVVVSGRDRAPGFFGWLIPISESRALVGLGTTGVQRPSSEYFEEMVSTTPLKPLLSGGVRGEPLAGCIPIGTVGRTFTHRVMVVGDAAAQVKPLSGGGLYTGLMAAKHCGGVCHKALDAGTPSAKVLGEYERLWRTSIGKELKNGALLRRFYLKLSDTQIDDLVSIMNNKELLPLVVNYGDIDSPSILAKIMLKRAPRLLKFTGPLLRALF